jgi:CBS domain-containing protein
MEFKVKDWMVNVIVYIDPDTTVLEALSIMRRRYIHSVIVRRTAESPDYGIITSTDISDKIVAEERNPSLILAQDIMTSPLMTVKEEMPLKECSKIMRKYCIHHLPVVDDIGELVGMISSTDFLVAAEAMNKLPEERLT